MAYHVEIRRSFHRARAFNLTRDRLEQGLVAPWLANRVVRLGDRDWEPRECDLQILEGPKLSHEDLALGQGWTNAERSGRNVAKELLSQRVEALAMLAGSADGEALARELLEPHGMGVADWKELCPRILDGTAERVIEDLAARLRGAGVQAGR